MKELNYDYVKNNGLIIFETIVGSRAHGTNTESSDVDKKFVYIAPLRNLMGFRYQEQIKVNPDHVGYELRRFLELLKTGNPTLLEMLNSPPDCVLYKHDLFDIILQKKDLFVTKLCRYALAGYAREQIKKASGLEKKQNWEKKNYAEQALQPIDFCQAILINKRDATNATTKTSQNVMPLVKFLQENDMDQQFCGLANVPHATGLYELFYDQNAHDCFSSHLSESEREANRMRFLNNDDKNNKEVKIGLGYRGIYKNQVIQKEQEEEGQQKSPLTKKQQLESSKTLRVSAIPLGETPVALVLYNKDSYSVHCRKVNEYKQWLKNRNPQRWVETEQHGQKIDGKNLMHCKRLIRMAHEIAQGKGVIVRRHHDAQELLEVRRGQVCLHELLSWANGAIDEMEKLFEKSALPDKVDEEQVDEMLLEIQKKFFKLDL